MGMEEGKNGKYSVKVIYDQLSGAGTGRRFTHIWKAKIPYKVKIFVWLIENNAILSKDNMIRRGWVGNSSCQFCDIEENISHLFSNALQVESFGG
jgi:hypothetical protein